MLDRLFPTPAGNAYGGHPAALWAFAALTAVTLWRSLHHILAADGGAQSIATIALDSFGPGGAQTVVAMFALWGISQLLLGLWFGVVLWRYRALVPAMYLLMLVEYALRTALPLLKDGVVKAGPAPGEVANWALLALLPVLLALALRRRL